MSVQLKLANILAAKKIFWRGVIFAGVIIVGYIYYQQYHHDQQLATKVYQQLQQVDQQLDQLQQTAISIKHYQVIQQQIASGVAVLTPANVEQIKPQLLARVSQATTTPDFAAATLKVIHNLDRANFNRTLVQLKLELRRLNYEQQLIISGFNARISQISAQLPPIKQEIEQIKSNNPQQLELAKLKFILHKLDKTAHSLQQSFFDTTLNAVITQIKLDASGHKSN